MVRIVSKNIKFTEKFKKIIKSGKLDNKSGYATKENVTLAIKDTFENESDTVKEIFKGF